MHDLARESVAHLTAERFQAFVTPHNERTADQQVVATYSDTLIDELEQSDVIVLGLPIYNFGLPSTLKAYFDHIARAGITFRYTENGPVGLLGDKAVRVMATSGGDYQVTAKDTQTQCVRDFFKFLGIRDVNFVYAEGLNLSTETKQAALTSADAQIATLAA